MEDYSIRRNVGPYPRLLIAVAHHVRCKLKYYIWLVGLTAVAFALYSYVSAPSSVKVVVVKTIETTETLGAIGRVRGEKTADLGLDVSGTVRGLYVREGDIVHAGQLLLSVDSSELGAAADAERAGLVSAQADMARVSRGPLSSEVRDLAAQLEQADSVGRAKIAEAEARLRDVQSGSRPQEIIRAQAQLDRQGMLLAKAERDLKRNRLLVQDGAIAQIALDQAQTDVDMARAAVTTQRQELSLLRSGSRAGLVAEARASVAEARATHDTSVRAARERLDTLKSNPRQEDVAAARAKVSQAEAQVRRSLQMKAKTVLRSPFEGVVAKLMVEQGQSVSAGQKIVAFQEIGKPVIEVETDEDNLSTLSRGMKAVVSADAYPGRHFEAVLYDLGSQVNSERGTIQIKLRPLGKADWLRPDLTVNVNIVTGTRVKRVIVPTDTITRVNGSQVVMVARDGVAVPVHVTTGAAGPDGVVVRGKLRDGEMVIRDAAKVTPHDDVNPDCGS